MAVEQLYYGWARRGREGRDRFQVVSVSAGLAASPGVLERAARLYQNSPDRASPTSFGWIDSDGLRYAFRRIDVGNDAFGRPGNFAVHLLIGAAEELAAGELLARYRSGLWWDGSSIDDDARLLSIDLHEVPRDSDLPRDDDAFGELAGCLLAVPTGQRLRVPLEADRLAEAARRFNAAVPGFLDQRSFSTYEPEGRARWFDVSGTTDPLVGAVNLAERLGDRRASWARVVRGLVAQEHELDAAHVAMSTATRATGHIDVSTLVAMLDALLDLGGHGEPDVERLLNVLSVPDGADVVLRDPSARLAIARRAATGESRTWKALSQGMDGLAVNIREAVGIDIGREAAHQGTIADTARSCRSLDNYVEAACIPAMLTAEAGVPSGFEHLDDETRHEMLRCAAQMTEPPPEAVAQLLRTAPARIWPAMTDFDLPTPWRASLVTRVLGNTRTRRDLIELLANHRTLTQAVAEVAGTEVPLASVVADCDRHNRMAIVDGASPVLDDERLWRFLNALPPMARLRAALARQSRTPLPAGDAWSDLVSSLVAERVHADVARVGAESPFLKRDELVLLRSCYGAASAAWLDFASALDRMRSAKSADALLGATDHARTVVEEITDDTQRAAAIALFLDTLVEPVGQGLIRLDQRVELVLAANRVVRCQDAAEGVFRGAWRRQQVDRRYGWLRLGLQYVALQVQQRKIPLQFLSSRIAAPVLADSIDVAVLSLSALERELLDESIAQIGKRARRWWRNVNEKVHGSK